MKIFIDFANPNGPMRKAMSQILTGNTENLVSADEADVVIVDEPEKVLDYLQKSEKRVVQYCYWKQHPMIHLIEDYPDRLMVVDLFGKDGLPMLPELLKCLGEIKKRVS